MLTLYLIRHGETDYNRLKIIQGGGIDSDLNEMGWAQGRAFFEKYKHLHFEAVYCSQLKRTAQTLRPFEMHGYTLEQHMGVNEFNWGELEGKSYNQETEAIFAEMTAAWKRGELDKRIPQGESPLQAWERSRIFFEALMNKYSHTDATILICTHGRMLRIILTQLLQKGLENMDTFSHHNTALNILQVSPNGEIQAKLLNDLSHLENLAG